MMIIPSVYRSETRIYHMHGRQVTYLCMVVRFGAERLRKVAMPPICLHKHRCLNFRRVSGFHHESHFFADSAERRRRMRRAIQSSFWMHSLELKYRRRESPYNPRLRSSTDARRHTSVKGQSCRQRLRESSQSERADAEMRPGECFTAL